MRRHSFFISVLATVVVGAVPISATIRAAAVSLTPGIVVSRRTAIGGVDPVRDVPSTLNTDVNLTVLRYVEHLSARSDIAEADAVQSGADAVAGTAGLRLTMGMP